MITKIKREDAYRKTVLKPTFSIASDLAPLDDVLISQDRAKNALELGLSIDKYGYNIYLSGQSSSRRKLYLKSILEEHAKKKDVPNDICYINNFDSENKNKPVLLEFKAGDGHKFKEAINEFAKQTKEDLRELFTGNNYKKELEMLEQKYSAESFQLIKEYSDLAREKNFILCIEDGNIIPLKCSKRGRPLSDKKISKLIMKNDDEYIESAQEINLLLVELYHKDSLILKQKEEELKNFDKNKSSEIILENLKSIKEEFLENAINEKNKNKLEIYFKGIEEYILDNLDLFTETVQIPNPLEPPIDEKTKFKEYFNLISVNTIVDNKDLKNAPIIFSENIEDEFDLLGGVMYETDKRSFTTDTDFSKIKAGDLLKANGGYLVIDIKDIIINDLWEEFKKSLTNKKVKFTGKTSSTLVLSDNLEPEPIEIDLKVILIGDLNVYYVLFEEDKIFRELFEIHAKFDYQIDRDANNEFLYARLLNKFCEEESLNTLSYDAVCRVIEHASKIVESQDKLAVYYSDIYKVLIEADKLSTIRGSSVIDVEDIEKSINNKIKRVNNATDSRDERIKNKEIILSVNDKKVGEVNALSVLDYSEYRIGAVSKLTANTYRSRKYNISSSDKEGFMTGNLHDKALNIVLGFLGETFGKDKIFPYSVNITFEQCYGGVDGDSATLAKTCAILSNLSGIPIKQQFGITGSMNQKGEAQIIGGVNEKIEGFFDLCKTKELESGGGVIIPRANISDLMLPTEILKAIEEDKFTIYAVDNIEDAIEILTGESFENICKIIKRTY